VARPVVVDGVTVLESASPVVWFTFPGEWHDIGRFHRPDGSFTGWYANILTPVAVDTDDWRTTDLFLDVFLTPAGAVHLLDAEELAEAERCGWVDADRADRARREAGRLVDAARAGAWPPPAVRDWTLARAERAASGTRAPPAVYRVRRDHES
jgi:predicted RNA-binding protein associated with RNAse of E/G family